MSTRFNPRYKLLPDGLSYIVDSDPDSLRKPNGHPNVGAICRAAEIDPGAFSRVVAGKRPWAGLGVAQRVSGVAAKARNISVDEALPMIFEPVEDGVAA